MLAPELARPAGMAGEVWLFALVEPAPFWLLCEGIFLGILPLTGISALQSETEGANLELILLTRLSRWRVVAGKWACMTAQAWLVFVSLLPYLIVRYFLGGIDLAQSAFLAACLLGANAAANAMVIGASAYRNWLMRIWMVAFQGGSAAFTLGVALFSVFTVGERLPPIAPELEPLRLHLLLGATTGAAALLHLVLGLQLGRGRVRLFDYPCEANEAGAVSALLIVCPLLLWAATGATLGFGFIPAAGMVIWFAWSLYPVEAGPPATGDPPPREATGAPLATRARPQ
jgi:hypothetical protein